MPPHKPANYNKSNLTKIDHKTTTSEIKPELNSSNQDHHGLLCSLGTLIHQSWHRIGKPVPLSCLHRSRPCHQSSSQTDDAVCIHGARAPLSLATVDCSSANPATSPPHRHPLPAAAAFSSAQPRALCPCHAGVAISCCSQSSPPLCPFRIFPARAANPDQIGVFDHVHTKAVPPCLKTTEIIRAQS
ncbi:hypothetical protein M0R45_036259 [Rubus argutus]|uniref:Uncharacterized protein n=1 Tax=Rubus argutus TaxID=59490 RepID=A0AAW1VWG2_RUBAR